MLLSTANVSDFHLMNLCFANHLLEKVEQIQIESKKITIYRVKYSKYGHNAESWETRYRKAFWEKILISGICTAIDREIEIDDDQ